MFTATAAQHGGQETTITSFHSTLLHHGTIIVGVSYSCILCWRSDSELSDGSVNIRPASVMNAWWAAARHFAVALACLSAGIAHAGDTGADPATVLRAKYGVLQDQLRHNQFQRPLHMGSSETSAGVMGDIYALVTGLRQSNAISANCTN